MVILNSIKELVHLIWVKKSKKGKVQEDVPKDLCHEAAIAFIAFTYPFTLIYPSIFPTPPVEKYGII